MDGAERGAMELPPFGEGIQGMYSAAIRTIRLEKKRFEPTKLRIQDEHKKKRQTKQASNCGLQYILYCWDENVGKTTWYQTLRTSSKNTLWVIFLGID